MTDTSTSDAQKELPQRALKQIRALCQGNGVAPDSVQIKSAQGTLINFKAITHLELHPETAEEIKKGRYETGEPIENPADLQKTIAELISSAIKNTDTRKYLTKMLTDRPDKGFSLHAEYLEVEPLKKDFYLHEPCGTCAGRGSTNCTRCGGQKREVCNQCHGRSMISCKYCSGSGFMQGPDGKQIQCNRCFGQRQIACPLCRKTGSIACRQCKGTGAAKCNSCNGSAVFTRIIHLIVKLKTLFEIDRASLPDPVIKIIEGNGTKMVEKAHIKLHAAQVKREDGGLAIEYEVEFPYGDLELSINGKPLKTHLFGYKGKMLRLPNFLDQLVEPYFNYLTKAAGGAGAVAGNIKKASKARLMAEGLLLSVQMPPKKAIISLKKKFPMGVSNDMIKQIILLSNKALTNVTRKTRFGGLGVGMALAALIDALYFIGPVRNMLGAALGNGAMITVADLLLIPLGGFIGVYIAKYMAQRPLNNLLGGLVPERQRGKFKPKAQNKFVASYVASAFILFVIIFITKFTGGTLPTWFPF